MTLHSTNDVRAVNRSAVLTQIAKHRLLSRRALADRTGLTAAAISRISRELIDAGIVSESDELDVANGPGRRTRALQLSSTSPLLVVMVISASKKAVSIANCRGENIIVKDLPDLDLSDAHRSIDTLCDIAIQLLKDNKLQDATLLGVSVVVAINTNPGSNETLSSSILRWSDVPLKPHIESRLNLPVHLEARAVALLESELWHSPVTQGRSVVLVNNGWRLGSSAYVNNALIESEQARLCQLAHLALPAQHQQCYCGQTGCLDAVASGAAIVGNLERRGLTKFTSSQSLNVRMSLAIEQAQEDKAVAAVFKEAGEHLGEGLRSVLSLYAPERIILAGAIGRQQDYHQGVKAVLDPVLKYHCACSLCVCSTTSLEAAVISGLNAFLFTDSLKLNQLLQQQKSA